MNGISSTTDYVLAVCILLALVASVIMCASDAKRRGRSPWLVSLLVVLLFPVGMLAWMAMRPKTSNNDSKGEFEPETSRRR
jgi:NADH:ubiquinone oxidoreductase subunit 6 (subunit J)